MTTLDEMIHALQERGHFFLEAYRYGDGVRLQLGR